MTKAPTLAVDGMIFQLKHLAYGSMWRALLTELAMRIPVVLLDRGDAPDLPGATIVPFPASTATHTAGESALLERVCRNYATDVFLSTSYATPLRQPALTIIPDMVAERWKQPELKRLAQEKTLAIHYARRRICLSNNDREALMVAYPSLSPESLYAFPIDPLDQALFTPRDPAEKAFFKASLGINGPFVILADPHPKDRARCIDQIKAGLAGAGRVDHTLICEAEDQRFSPLTSERPDIRMVAWSDADRALAYATADAVFVSTQAEDHALRRREVKACGCPAFDITPDSDDGTLAVTVAAAKLERQPPAATPSPVLSYVEVADQMLNLISAIHQEASEGQYDPFFEDWSRLRRLQAEVDF